MGTTSAAVTARIDRRAVYLIPIGAAFLMALAFVRPSGGWEWEHGARVVVALHAAAASSPQEPGEILATGRSSRWHFRYPGRDGAIGTPDDLTSVGDLGLPLGAAPRMVLVSDDSIYTFSVPEMGIRGMAVPDIPSSVSIRADRPGTFELAADPMCGLRPNHVGRLRIMTRPEFATWLRGLSRSARMRPRDRVPPVLGTTGAVSPLERP